MLVFCPKHEVLFSKISFLELQILKFGSFNIGQAIKSRIPEMSQLNSGIPELSYYKLRIPEMSQLNSGIPEMCYLI